jgi:hypothetical protein
VIVALPAKCLRNARRTAFPHQVEKSRPKSFLLLSPCKVTARASYDLAFARRIFDENAAGSTVSQHEVSDVIRDFDDPGSVVDDPAL